MAFNVFKCFFAFIAIYTGLIGLLINFFPNNLPRFLVNSYLYGVFSTEAINCGISIKVPKRWFRHFYVFAVIWSCFFFILTTIYYLHIVHIIPKTIKDFLSYFTSGENNATVSATATLFALFLITLQAFKRYYETHYISVFSNSYIDISHYMIGYLHYFGTILSIVIESPGFSISGNFEHSFQMEDISFKMLVSSFTFLWAWWNQYKSACTLADLRKNKKGEIVTEEHQIPNGGLFFHVSSPHRMCEIVMYICLSVILYENHTFHYVTAWVIVNQVESAFLSHKWYQKNFKNYPKNRKTIIPYVF